MKQLLKTVLPLALLLMSAVSVAAEWEIDNAQSQLSFISIKKGDVAEVHRFGEIAGGLQQDGQFSVKIALETVNTGIQIRDSRMRTFLFNTAQFPEATLTASLSPEFISNLTVGQSELTMVDAQLDLNEQSQPIKLDVRVTKVSESSLLVISAQPVVLDVADYALTDGVEKLRELAGLPSISQAVPVSFYLTLNAK
jgi:polyisoprenoid-binding protein YceI